MLPTTATYSKGASLAEVLDRARANDKDQEYKQGNFTYTSHSGHILQSKCHHSAETEDSTCLKCRFNNELKLSELPEMVFPRNQLNILFGNASIEFNALDALKLVCDDKLPDVQVHPSTLWQSARQEKLKQITETHKPFDWTYTTHYKGTLNNCKVEKSDVRIDMERLKRREQIAFHTSICLFEDELADHGIAKLSARLRVMSTGYFFALLRFYMRVDSELIRVCDTRIVGDDNSNFVLREWQLREAKYSELKHVPSDVLLDMDVAWMHLPIIEEHCEKITAI